jgi:hypothetical protein
MALCLVQEIVRFVIEKKIKNYDTILFLALVD